MKEVEVVTIREYLFSPPLNSFKEHYFFYLNNQEINLAWRKASNNCGYVSTDWILPGGV